MTTNTDYETKIASHQHDELLTLWEKVKAGATQTEGWDAGRAFEYLVVRAFEVEGAQVRYPYSIRENGLEIEQIDGVVYVESLACLLECKDRGKNVNYDAIAKLSEQLERRPVSVVGAVLSTSDFTDAALKNLRTRTSLRPIFLWYADEIEVALRRQWMRRGLLAKYRYYVETTEPHYNLLEMLL